MIVVRRRMALQIPRGEQVASVPWTEGKTLREYAPEDFGGDYGCVWNGRSVLGENLDSSVPRDGDELIFYREQHYVVVAAISAIAAFLATYGPAIAISLAISLVSFLVQLLLAPKGGAKKSPSQIFTGLSNRTRRGETIPVLVGERRCAPKMISFYTEVRADGSNVFRGLYCISVGRIEGVGGETESFDRRTRDAKRVPIAAVTDGPFLANQRFEASPSGARGRILRRCSDGDSYLYYLPLSGTVASGDVLSLSLLATETTATDNPEEDPTFDGLEINGNPLRSYRGAEVSFRPGEMNQTPISGWNLTHTVVPVQVTLDQKKDADGRPEFGFDDLGEPFLYQTTQAVDWVVLNWAHPSLYKSGASGQHAYRVYYHVRYRKTDVGGGTPGPWYYAVWDRTTSQNTTYDVSTVEADRRAFMLEELRLGPFASAYKVDFLDENLNALGRDHYDIEVARYNGNVADDGDGGLGLERAGVHEPPNRNSNITLESVDEVLDLGLSYPGLALIDLSVIATDQLNSEPVFAGVFKGLRCAVWDGVDAESPVFSWIWSDNPAWIALTYLLHWDVGVGGKLHVADIDLPSFKAAADSCDQLVDDGAGGSEKMALYDEYIEEPIAWWDALQRVGAAARFQPVQTGSRIKLRVEEPRERVQVFGMGNIIQGTFKRTFIDAERAPSQVTLNIRNRDENDDSDRAIWEDEDADGPLRQAPAEDLPGVRRLSQGLREAKLRGLLGKAITDMIEFQAFLDSMALEVGDRFGLNHDTPLWGYSGLIGAGSTTTGVVIDHEVILADGVNYECLVRHGDDRQETRQVVSPAGTYPAGSLIEVGAAWSVVPVRHCVWAIGPENEVVLDWNCIRIERSEDGKATFTAVNYVESALTESLVLDDTGTPAAFSVVGKADTIPGDVTNLQLASHYAILPDGSIREGIRVSWLPPVADAAIAAELFYRKAGRQAWVPGGRTRARQHLIVADLDVGMTYDVAVCGVSPSGMSRQHPDDAPRAQLVYQPTPQRPSAPVSASIDRSSNILAASWSSPGPDADGQPRNRQVSHHELRRGDDWRVALPMLSTKGFSAELRNWVPGPDTLLIKAADAHAQESPSGAYVPMNQKVPSGFVAVLDRNERELGWPATKIQAGVNGSGRLELDPGDSTGFYFIDEIDLGKDADWTIGVALHACQNPLHWTGEASRLEIGAVTDGPFTAYETITGSVSGATAVVLKACTDGELFLYLKPVTGVLAADDVLTGGTSGATATMKAGPWGLCADDPVWDDRDVGGFYHEDVMTDTGTGSRTGVTIRCTKEDGTSSILQGGQGTVRGRYLEVEIALCSDDPDNFGTILSEFRLVVMEPVSRVEGLFTGELVTTKSLKPDGAGGVHWV
jgi:hypothetical protein